ncbi:MAG: hypothetical protein LBI48_08970 [Burkholderiaceae bacterium]|nr:hypothetical protein [Burkholderiaceae bacterium]
MPHPTPAIVAQDAVRRLPRWALIALCLSYVLPGYIGRAPWKNADILSFGHMLALAHAPWPAWLHPTLDGAAPDSGALLPYWLGALALQWAPGWMAPDFAVRIPFVLLLGITLAATWHATYHLAQHRGAQPVAFAFGGEAPPAEYARALADASLLALLATLGLAQLSHETTPALAQLACASLIYFGLAALRLGAWPAWAALALGLPGLALSGAASTALIWAAMALLGLLAAPQEEMERGPRLRALLLLALIAAACALLATLLGLPRWPIDLPLRPGDWRTLARLFLWFTWPVWPLALWTLWRWRCQLLQIRSHRHLGLPVMMALVPIITTALTHASDRALLIALPALATLAAFALPTFKRGAAAFIDWFTVLFFTGWAIAIWVIWLSLHTGIPAKPAANVARLAPGFTPIFQWPALAAALAGTLAWIALARWRTGRHRTALWKSLVLPAAGATLCWLLLMTLWLPGLDYARSVAPQMAKIQRIIGQPPCVQTLGLGTAQLVGARFHGGWQTVPLTQDAPQCPWLLAGVNAKPAFEASSQASNWTLQQRVGHPTDANDTLLIYRRKSATDMLPVQ